MAIQYRESPHIRKWINKYLRQNPAVTLADMARGYYVEKRCRHNLWLTNGWRIQAKKMLQEQEPLCGRIKILVAEYGLDCVQRVLREVERHGK